MPAQQFWRGQVPFLLRLDHEQRPGDDEARSSNHLRQPVCSVLAGGGSEPIVYRRQSGKARDPLIMVSQAALHRS